VKNGKTMSHRIGRNAFLGLTLLTVLGVFVARDQFFSTADSANQQPASSSAAVTDQSVTPTILENESSTPTTVAEIEQPGTTKEVQDVPPTGSTAMRKSTARATPTVKPTRVVRDSHDDDDEDFEDDESEGDD
jgi:hypothetical protein